MIISGRKKSAVVLKDHCRVGLLESYVHSFSHVLSFYVQMSNLALYLADPVIKTVGLPVRCIWVDHSLRVCLVEELCVVELHAVDCRYLTFVEPLDPLAVFPKSKLYLAVLWNEIGA